MNKNVLAFSGGKDSTAMLHMLLERGLPIHDVYFFDTDWEFPQLYEHIDLVESRTGIPITKIRYYRKFDDLLIKYGWPPASRGGWCTSRKQNTCIRYERAIKTTTAYIGFAFDEGKRAGRPTVRKLRKWKVDFPLIRWEMTQEDNLAYCKNLGYDWGGLYNHFNRVSCFCCPKAGQRRIRMLKLYYPDLFDRYQQMCRMAHDINQDQRRLFRNGQI